MSGRHRSHGLAAGGRRRRAPWAVLAVVTLVGVAGVTVRIVSADASGCSGDQPLHVVVTPELVPALEDIGNSFLATRPEVSGKCVSLKVDGVPAATVASSLTVLAGRAIDTAATPEPTPSDDALPAVWIPDSTAWLGRVKDVDSTAFAADPRSIATSPVLIAMPEAAAKLVGWPAAKLPAGQLKPLLADGGSLKLGIAEPRRETASLAAAMVLGDALATTDDELPALVKTFRTVTKTSSTGELLRSFGPKVNAGPASEQAILSYDMSSPPLKLVGVGLDPALPILDYPYAIRSGVDRDTSQAAELFRNALLGEGGVQRLAKSAFREPDGQIGSGFPASSATDTTAMVGVPVDDAQQVDRALSLWTAANSASRTLALFDVTSSMATPMVTSSGESTRAQVMVAAAQGGLSLFAGDSQVGMWAFGAQYQELLPIAELDAAGLTAFDQRMAEARPSASNSSQLYTTLLAAYKVMKDGYDPNRLNIIIALTDGSDSDPDDVRREQFKQDIQKLADPTKPIRVVLIGIGVSGPDVASLQAIADIVGGGYFPLTSPEQIQTIFLKALLRVGAA